MRQSIRVGSALLATLLLLAGYASAREKPATTAAVQPPEAAKFVSEMEQAYRDLKSLVAAGSIHVDINIAGQVQQDDATFTSSFSAPALYRHEMKGSILIGSDGKKAYAFDQKANSYIQNDAAPGRAAVRDLPFPTARVLQMQNPSLLLAISDNGLAELLDGATDQVVQPGVKRDDVTGDSLAFDAADGRKITILADPDTHLLRLMEVDMADVFVKRGAPDVKAAKVTIRYAQNQPAAKVEQSQFAWAPPPGARQQQVTAAGDPISPLQGKPAPEFALRDLADKEQKLSSARGKVVVLDFWATWCGPCVESLPELNRYYAAHQDKGLAVFAINAQEAKDDVQQFIKQQKLILPVVLDTDGKVAELYSVDGYPTTVIIGRDGKVRKVFAGIPPAGEEEILRAIDAVLAEK